MYLMGSEQKGSWAGARRRRSGGKDRKRRGAKKEDAAEEEHVEKTGAASKRPPIFCCHFFLSLCHLLFRFFVPSGACFFYPFVCDPPCALFSSFVLLDNRTLRCSPVTFFTCRHFGGMRCSRTATSSSTATWLSTSGTRRFTAKSFHALRVL